MIAFHGTKWNVESVNSKVPAIVCINEEIDGKNPRQIPTGFRFYFYTLAVTISMDFSIIIFIYLDIILTG